MAAKKYNDIKPGTPRKPPKGYSGIKPGTPRKPLRYDEFKPDSPRGKPEKGRKPVKTGLYGIGVPRGFESLLQGPERDAYLALNKLFSDYGLASLAPKIFEYVKGGYSADTISILLQDTKEYKERFIGNEARRKAGLPVLSPGEYLATESSYRQIMQGAGLPSGYYDQPSDFNAWIGGNVSPTEVQSRVDLATQATILANPDYRKALNQMGISDNELTAYFLDPKKALPYLQKSAATAAVGAEAISQGLTFDKLYSEGLVTKGVGVEQARAGYAEISSSLKDLKDLSSIYGSDWNQRLAEEAILEGKSGAIGVREGIISREKGSFSGAAGGARGGFAQTGGAR